MIDLSDYYSGGYFLICANKPDWPQLKHQTPPDKPIGHYENGASAEARSLRNELLPAKLISLSRCICPRLQVAWGWTPPDREAALQFGIAEDRFEAFVLWCENEYQLEMDYYSIFHTPAAARRFAERFMPQPSHLHLIGAGLHQSLALTQWRDPADEELYGIEQRIRQHLPLEPGGTTLGFEVASFTNSDVSHSWICSGLPEDMQQLFGIRPGQFGLIERREDAQRVYEWIVEDEQRGHRAEPEPYDYWLLVSYPLS